MVSLAPRTWHFHGARLIVPAPDAQLTEAVPAPALDPATRLDNARVDAPQSNGYGGDAWHHGPWERGGWGYII